MPDKRDRDEAPVTTANVSADAARAQADMAEAMAEAEENPRDETVPGGRYKVVDGVDARGRPTYREVNAYGGDFKEDQDPDRIRVEAERRTGLM
jgi:hypothetical protein